MHKKMNNIEYLLVLLILLLLSFFSISTYDVVSDKVFDIFNKIFFIIESILILFIIGSTLKSVKKNKHSITKSLNTNISLEKMLMLSAITFFIISSCYLIFFTKEYFFNPNYNIKTDNLLSNDTVLGILSIVTIFAGMLAYIFKSIVNNNITAIVKRENKINRYYTIYNAYSTLGLAQYNSYTNLKSIKCATIANNLNPKLQPILKHFYVALDAIQKTVLLTNVNTNRQHIRYLLHLCIIKNNLAWVIYEEYSFPNKNNNKKEITKRKEEAKRFINFVYKHIDTFPNKINHTKHWEDTYQKIMEWTK